MYFNLRKIREERKFTCDYMAKALGYANRSVYSKKERGLLPITIEEAKTIADILKVKIDDIFL